MITRAALLFLAVVGCSSPEWPVPTSPTSVDRLIAPGDSLTVHFASGWDVSIDARRASRGFQTTIRDTPRQDWPSPPAASGIEFIYAAIGGDTLNDIGVELAVRITRTVAVSTAPMSVTMGYLTAPPPANVMSFLDASCDIRAQGQSNAVVTSSVFRVGGGGFGRKAYLALAPYFWQKEYGPLCKP